MVCTRRWPMVSVSTSGARVVVIRASGAGASGRRVAIDVMWHRPTPLATPTRRNPHQLLELEPRRAAPLARLTQQPQEHLRGRQRVAAGAMARRVLDVVETREVVERATGELRYEAARHLHRAEPPPFHALARS